MRGEIVLPFTSKFRIWKYCGGTKVKDQFSSGLRNFPGVSLILKPVILFPLGTSERLRDVESVSFQKLHLPGERYDRFSIVNTLKEEAVSIKIKEAPPERQGRL